MDDMLGYVIAQGIIGILLYELVRQMRDYTVAKKGELSSKNDLLMIISLTGIILFYSLNILMRIGVVSDAYITSNITAIGVFVSLIAYVLAKFRKKKTSTKTEFLLK